MNLARKRPKCDFAAKLVKDRPESADESEWKCTRASMPTPQYRYEIATCAIQFLDGVNIPAPLKIDASAL
jgi:hypothetical protein